MQRLFDFDIPALPLSDALDRYTVISGRPTLYSSLLVQGRHAFAVHGRYDVGAALRLLLQGTGLVAEELRDGEAQLFLLKTATPGSAVSVSESDHGRGRSAPAPRDRYDALVQAMVWQELCSARTTAPGNYRALLRFNIDGVGQVHRPRLLGSTGSDTRDAALTLALGRLSMGEAPPSDMVQPFTVLILPQAQAAGRSCPMEPR